METRPSEQTLFTKTLFRSYSEVCGLATVYSAENSITIVHDLRTCKETSFDLSPDKPIRVIQGQIL